MRKLLIALPGVLLLPFSAFADIGACGVGSKLFAGQAGIAPQVLALTTNGYSSNTLAVSTGTSGCSQDGVVRSDWKTAMFIDANTTKLARDMSVGEGETLESLASLMGMDQGEKELFFATSKNNFGRIFPTSETNSYQVMASLKQILNETPELSKFASKI